MSDQMHIDSLWKRFLKGDDRAYTELYNLYIDDLFAYGMHFTIQCKPGGDQFQRCDLLSGDRDAR